MSRRVPHLSAVVSVLSVLSVVACSDSDRTSTAGSTTGATTTVSTGAETSSTASTAPTGKLRAIAVPTVVPSYADAERAFHRGNYDEAAGMFESYTASNPDNAWGHYMLGLSAWKTGDHTRALEAFDAALRIEPTHRKSLLNSARVLLETSRAQDALDRVEQALAIEPLSGEALRLKGRAHNELGQIPQAIDAYERAIALDDRDVWAMNNLGYLYIQQGRSDSALPPLARAVEIRSNVPVFQNNFGTALERSGYFVSACQAYQAALQADSSYTKAAVGLDRVNAHGTESDSSTVDVTALSKEFQAQVEQWRARTTVADDSAKEEPGDSSGMARDSVTQ
jgi:predicted Zn-dependent protease